MGRSQSVLLHFLTLIFSFATTICYSIYSEDENQDWDFFWCEREWLKENFDHMYFPDHVRLCHFRNHFEVG